MLLDISGGAVPPSEELREASQFVSWCVERYKRSHALTAWEAVRLFEGHDVLEWLFEFYDVEHLLSEDEVMDDMDVMLGRATRDRYGVVSR